MLGEKAATNISADMQLLDIASPLIFTKGDEYAIAMPFSVTIHSYAGGTAIIDQEFTVTPGGILQCDHIVLQKSNTLVFGITRPFPFNILKNQMYVMLKHLIKTWRIPKALCQIDDSMDNIYHIRVEDSR